MRAENLACYGGKRLRLAVNGQEGIPARPDDDQSPRSEQDVQDPVGQSVPRHLRRTPRQRDLGGMGLTQRVALFVDRPHGRPMVGDVGQGQREEEGGDCRKEGGKPAGRDGRLWVAHAPF